MNGRQVEKKETRDMPKAASTSYRIMDMPAHLRPRERLERYGVESLSEDELLAILLRTGIPGSNAKELALQLLKCYNGSLATLARAPKNDLTKIRGIGKAKAQMLQVAFDLARRLTQEAAGPQYAVRRPEDAAVLLRETANKMETEAFWVLLLNTKNVLLQEPRPITRGLLDASLVHPREVFRDAVRAACAAVILVHNHPSGDPAPSAEDIRITHQIVQAGRVVDIRVLDHVVLGRVSPEREHYFCSLRDMGLVEFD